ncbi:hypothetical protein ACKI2C_46005 [Streptomyces brasiliscabiei]|uniref:hypothetical protein n=1 Tax=Streptomyces brasiliscabiei TaxID=2736302 RepID=UPI0038F65AD4
MAGARGGPGGETVPLRAPERALGVVLPEREPTRQVTRTRWASHPSPRLPARFRSARHTGTPAHRHTGTPAPHRA